MTVEIEKDWMAVNPYTDEIVCVGETKEEVRSRLRGVLQLDPEDYDIVANPKNVPSGPI